MTLNRQHLYKSFNAVSDLTEKVGTTHMTVEAEVDEGFDPVGLCNAVLGSLEETEIDKEEQRWMTMQRWL